MPKIPDLSLERDRQAKIYKILREDAERTLKQGGLSQSVEKLYRLLLSQSEMVGIIGTWMPSLDARRKIAAYQEDSLIPDGIQLWLADEVRDLILSHRSGEAVKLIEKFTLPGLIETLEPIAAKKTHLFYLLGDIWFIKFENKATWVDDTMGVRYVAKLLEHPYHDFSPADLKDAIIGIYDAGSKAVHSKDGYLMPGQKTRMVKVPANKKTIEAAFSELAEKLSIENPESRLEAQDEWRELKKVYKDDVSVALDAEGKPVFRWKRNPDSSDRSNLTQQIKSAKEKIGARLPRIKEHLKLIKTGNPMKYIPPEHTPSWFIYW
jgi:hypothetical protein